MTIAICDDHAEILTIVEDMLKEALTFDECGIASFTDAEAFLRHLKNNRTDVAIVDIMLADGVSGVDIAKRINRDCPDTVVIYISSFTEYAEELYNTQHLHFLKKPLTPERLLDVIQKASKKLHGETVSIVRKGSTLNIKQSSIIMAESIRRDLIVHIAGEVPVTYVAKLADFEQQLNPATFLRCHRSYIVNMEHITEIVPGRLMLTGGLSAPVSRSYQEIVKKKTLRKMGGAT